MMDKQYRKKFDLEAEIENAEAAEAPCMICGKVFAIAEMRSVPEAEGYARQVGTAMCKGLPLPEVPDDEKLKARYGFGRKAVFCEDCLKRVLAGTFVHDILKSE